MTSGEGRRFSTEIVALITEAEWIAVMETLRVKTIVVGRAVGWRRIRYVGWTIPLRELEASEKDADREPKERRKVDKSVIAEVMDKDVEVG